MSRMPNHLAPPGRTGPPPPPPFPPPTAIPTCRSLHALRGSAKKLSAINSRLSEFSSPAAKPNSVFSPTSVISEPKEDAAPPNYNQSLLSVPPLRLRASVVKCFSPRSPPPPRSQTSPTEDAAPKTYTNPSFVSLPLRLSVSAVNCLPPNRPKADSR
jgi:hypothetical protein